MSFAQVSRGIESAQRGGLGKEDLAAVQEYITIRRRKRTAMYVFNRGPR
jgi:hypothetical protein